MKKVLLEVELEGNIRPEQVRDILKEIDRTLPASKHGDSVVIVSGRLPVWAFGAIVHHLHPFLAVATFDPRLQRGVVVASHTPELKVGDLVSTEHAEKRVVRLESGEEATRIKVS